MAERAMSCWASILRVSECVYHTYLHCALGYWKDRKEAFLCQFNLIERVGKKNFRKQRESVYRKVKDLKIAMRGKTRNKRIREQKSSNFI